MEDKRCENCGRYFNVKGENKEDLYYCEQCRTE